MSCIEWTHLVAVPGRGMYVEMNLMGLSQAYNWNNNDLHLTFDEEMNHLWVCPECIDVDSL